MDLRHLLSGILRRWYVLLATLLVAAGLSVLAFRVAPVSYDASASSLLLPPKSSVGTGGNPLLYLGGLGPAVEILAAKVNAPEVRGPIEEAHPDATFTAAQDLTTTGPILKVSVSSSSADDSMATLQAVERTIPGALQAMQDELSVPDRSRLSMTTLVADDTATADTKNRDRAVIAIAGAGVAGGVLLTGFVDGLLLARAGARRSGPQPRTRKRAGAAAPDWTGVTSGGATENMKSQTAEAERPPSPSDSESASASPRVSN